MKKIIITLLSLIFIISMITCVYAASGSINFGASSDTVIKGKTFTVTVAGTADSKITGMQAGLSYEKDKLSIENKSAGQGYFDASASNEIAIGSTSAEGLSQAGTLYTITFKVLDTASEGETKISLTNAVLATSDGQIDPSNKDVTVTIKSDDTTAGGTNTPSDDQNPSNGDNGNNGDSGNNGNSNTDKKEENKNVNSNKASNKNKNTNTTKKLPQTGVESTTLFAIIALAVVGITSFISYRKYKNI